MSDFEESDVEIEKEIDQEEEEITEEPKIQKKSNVQTKKISQDDEADGEESDIDSLLSEDDNQSDDFLDNEFDEEDIKTEDASKSILDTDDAGKPPISPINSDLESDDEEEYQKFDIEINSNFISKVHPESITSNAIEIEKLCVIKRNLNGEIDDELHRTTAILLKYEKTKILGQRAKQINNGSKPLIAVPADVLDGYLIAQLELTKKILPYIIRRPLPNGTSEYWKIADLEII